jgi:hypothetical protein
MPRPIATETTKAIEIRPILLNFMRFLNLASGRVATFCREQLFRDTIPSPIVEVFVSLCHFRKRIRLLKLAATVDALEFVELRPP